MQLNNILIEGAGSVVAAGAVYLMQKLGINAKILAAIKGAKGDDIKIPNHPKATEALDALEDSGLDVLKDLVTAHPDIADVLEDKLTHDSLTNVGAWLAANYGPEIVADSIKRGEALIGTELKIIFGGQQAVEQAAINRMGLAAKNNIETLKTIAKLPSGNGVVVKPADQQ